MPTKVGKFEKMQYLRIKEEIVLYESSCMHHMNITINTHIKYICAIAYRYVYYVIYYNIIIYFTNYNNKLYQWYYINIYNWYIITAQYSTGYHACLTVSVVS